MTYTASLLRDELIRDEGLRLKPYRDTVGLLTIGVGRNIEQRGISEATAHQMLDEDIGLCCADLDKNIPWWRSLSDARQRAILNLCFNMGWPTLATFKNTLAHLQAGDYSAAADELLASKYAQQVGARAQRIAGMIREG